MDGTENWQDGQAATFRPEELAERLGASGYDIPASEIEAGMELHFRCLVRVGQSHNGYKNIEEFLVEAGE